MDIEILKNYLEESGPLLEIGPLDNPFLSRENYNVYYADIRSKEAIFKEYLKNGSFYTSFNVQSPEELYSKILPIDFVIKDSYKTAVGDMRFFGIFSSHVIEHTADIIQHLLDLSEILEDDGYLVMAIPDKRYTFDRFREVTPFRDALDVYINGESTTARLVFDCTFFAHPCNNAAEHHANTVSFLPVALDESPYTTAYKEYCAVKGGLWPNAHIWVFTYPSFIAFLRDGIRSGLFPFSLEYSKKPDDGKSSEFHIVLKKNPLVQSDARVKHSEIIKLQQILDDIDGISYIDNLVNFCKNSDSLYIYGAGNIGKGVYHLISELGFEVRGFIVSDNQPKADSLMSKPVYYLSEITEGSILVSLLAKKEVIPRLKEMGLKHFATI